MRSDIHRSRGPDPTAGRGPGWLAGRLGSTPGALLLLAGGLLVLLPGLASIEVIFRTDARYLEAAREMFESGALGVPTLAGVPHLTKPPLAYWAAVAGYALFGVGPFGGRFFAALAVLGTALLVFHFARRAFSGAAALAAGAVVLGSVLPFALAHGLSTDPFLLLAVTGATLSLAGAAEGERPRGRVVGVGAWLGLAVLAKGPIGPLLVVSSWGVHRLLGGPGLRVGWKTWALALLVFAAIAVPWFVWIEWRVPGTLEWLVGHELLGRLGPEGPGHREPWYTIAAAWLAGALPFSPLLLLVLLRSGGDRATFAANPALRLLWVASWLPVVLFSLPSGKLPTYVAPALPPAAVLLAAATAPGRSGSRWEAGAMAGGFLCVAAMAGLLLAGLAAPGWLAGILRGLDPSGLNRGPVLVAGALAVGVLSPGAGWRVFARRPEARDLLALAGLSALALSLGVRAVGPALRGDRAGAELARRIPDVRVVHFGTFLPSFLFYFRDVERTLVAGFRPLAPPHVPMPSRVRLSAEQGLAAMRESRPTLLLVKIGRSAELAERTGGDLLWCGRKHCLIANASAAVRAGEDRAPPEAAPEAPAPVGDRGRDPAGSARTSGRGFRALGAGLAR